MKDKLKEERTWVYGGKFVYGDNPFKEALYALEDELICFDERDGKFIPHYKMIRVMCAYEKFLKRYFKKLIEGMEKDAKENPMKKKLLGGKIIEVEEYNDGYNQALRAIKGVIKKI